MKKALLQTYKSIASEVQKLWYKRKKVLPFGVEGNAFFVFYYCKVIVLP